MIPQYCDKLCLLNENNMQIKKLEVFFFFKRVDTEFN